MAEKIRLRDLASAAGVSSRTLGYQFLRAYGLTPMAVVKAKRLAKAHQLLLNANPATTTVASIARSCGFSHMGQFSQDYKRANGETPSTTLSRRTKPSGEQKSIIRDAPARHSH